MFSFFIDQGNSTTSQMYSLCCSGLWTWSLLNATQTLCQLSCSPSLLFTKASLSTLPFSYCDCVLRSVCLFVSPFLHFLREKIKNLTVAAIELWTATEGFPALTWWLHVLCLVLRRHRKHTGNKYWHRIDLCVPPVTHYESWCSVTITFVRPTPPFWNKEDAVVMGES